MDKNAFAPTPPMGWNSYDYYDTTVTEDRVRANADIMAARLRPFGWEYVVVDIQWYAHGAGTLRDRYQYLPFGEIELDEYSRALPCPERFPSAAGGKGFGPLADYVHGLGLKFGIHIMRGIPRIAAHRGGAILGTDVLADEVADPASICAWNPDMYGLRPDEQGSRAYYESLFELYAEWGVDFVKCDDICRMDAASAKKETILLHDAIQKAGRPMVLSLSPGPALLAEAWHYERYANMWRITDDLWDTWPHVLNMFVRCEHWQDHVADGRYPDCDMLPLGVIGKGFGDERSSRLTHDEQRTVMTLWCIFRSPLMLGAELTLLDDETVSLITNASVLSLLSRSRGARQVERDERRAIWLSEDIEDGSIYLAVFNLADEARTVAIEDGETSRRLGFDREWTDLWSGEKSSPHTTSTPQETMPAISVEAHGARLFKIR
jgi:alpha-galactosidase